jgi:hypothetical protein
MTDYLYNIPNSTFAGEGLDNIVAEILTEVPSLTPMILMFVFFVVLIGGITRQIGRTGTADYPMWFTVAALCSFFVALLVSVSSGFILLDWLVVNLLVLIGAGTWFFLEQRQSEV